MTSRSRLVRSPSALAPESLAFALSQAADLVAAVLDGRNLTDAYEQWLGRHPQWPDGTRGAVRDLAWGTLRDYGRGDLVLRELLHKPLPPSLHALLLVALYRLATRPEQAHTIVDQAVEAAAVQAPGLKGVVNGVLRNRLRDADAFQRRQDSDPVARYRHPDWWIRRMRTSYPEQWEAALEAGNQRPPMAVRVNPRRASVETVEAEFRAEGIGCRRVANDALVLDCPTAVAALPGFAAGRVSVQDAGAQWTGAWLDLADEQRVLDACAAPGGKAAQILESADVELVALELDPTRVRRINENLARLALTADVKTVDCRRVDEWWDGRPFDRILADVPCSASGVARRHPDIKWLRRREDIPRFAAQQAEILEALWPTLAIGGKLLYVTCSVFDEENKLQIDRFLARHPDAQREVIGNRPEQQLLPNADHDGFFYALLRKHRQS
ncbi:MAG: 16S rRNA (cytosine(967)-C(5))-methyltransferase RsmB [Aromatoleum sp.]|uniref:16S rRNA (cytosine(967)-C(5))-methyltransferase RsmB n=1 Tax=Aromatoleum sp. TaxID=2307007 RepID=UPI002893DB90|nr:16S rRNA (cytosine(967)-C(5))-methyltransferase RsmB [Aromatoleum sp.]MDT3671537.1 16S rRNA (cytosine(967)-C(5))-methyltransferase RsmB [Aromatoleum sp.]